MKSDAIHAQLRLSSLLNCVRASGISDLHELALKRKAEGADILDLTTGEPDFSTPKHICEAAVRAIRCGETRYTAVDGTPELKGAILEKFARDNDLHYAEDGVVVTDGAKPLLAVAIRCVLDPGDEVIFASPCWPSHSAMARFAGGKPALINTDASCGFKISTGALSSALIDRTRIVVLCSPSNPAGSVCTEGELGKLADVLRVWPNVLVLSDDIYEHVRFTTKPFATTAQTGEDIRERTLTVNGVSKAYAMTGWWIGFGVGPPEWVRGIRRVLTQTSGGPCSISQAATVAALEGPQTTVSVWKEHYKRRRDLMVTRLRQNGGVGVHAPDGAFYLMPDVSGLFGKSTSFGQRIQSSADVATCLLEHGVMCIPGAVFNADSHIRMSIAVSDETLEIACDRIEEACRSLS